MKKNWEMHSYTSTHWIMMLLTTSCVPFSIFTHQEQVLGLCLWMRMIWWNASIIKEKKSFDTCSLWSCQESDDKKCFISHTKGDSGLWQSTLAFLLMSWKGRPCRHFLSQSLGDLLNEGFNCSCANFVTILVKWYMWFCFEGGNNMI